MARETISTILTLSYSRKPYNFSSVPLVKDQWSVMRRQSSYERYNEYNNSRNGDHRYHEQTRSISQNNLNYGYERPEAARAPAYDPYHYSNYSNNQQYDYSRYPYPQNSQLNYNSYNEQPSSSRGRVEYTGYYGADYKRYYDPYSRGAPGYSNNSFYRESTVANVDYRYPASTMGQRNESTVAVTPTFDRYQSGKARLYSFGYRKGNRNMLASPKKVNKFDAKNNNNKFSAVESRQEVVEEKVEEVSPSIQSLAKLTLSMINYRITLSLLSLNLSIKEEPNEATLFLRNPPASATAAETSSTTNTATTNATTTASFASTQLPIASSLSGGIIAPSLSEEVSHSTENMPPSTALKRSSSAMESGRDDYNNSAYKRQRSHSIEEEGIVREKPTYDSYNSRDNRHNNTYSSVNNNSNSFPAQHQQSMSGGARDGDYGRYHHASQAPPSMQRSQSYESNTGVPNSGGRQPHGYYDNSGYPSRAYSEPVSSSAAPHHHNNHHLSPREYSSGGHSSAGTGPGSAHHRDSRYPNPAVAHTTPSGAGHPHDTYHSHNRHEMNQGASGVGSGAYNNYPEGTSSSYVNRSRYYDNYEERGRDYSYSYPSHGGPISRESSTAGYNAMDTRDRSNNNYPSQHSGPAAYHNHNHRQTAVAPSLLPATTAVAPAVAAIAPYDYEEGEYRERSHTRPPVVGRHNQAHDYYSNNMNNSNHSSAYPTDGYSARGGAGGNSAAASVSSREYYDYDNSRRYSGAVQTPTQSGRDFSRSGSANFNRYDRVDPANTRHSSASTTPYHGNNNHHAHGGHTPGAYSAAGHAPSSGQRGVSSTLPSLRTPR